MSGALLMKSFEQGFKEMVKNLMQFLLIEIMETELTKLAFKEDAAKATLPSHYNIINLLTKLSVIFI